MNQVCRKATPSLPFQEMEIQCVFMWTQLTHWGCIFRLHFAWLTYIRRCSTTINLWDWFEWLFGDIVNYFKFLNFKKNLKIGLSQVRQMHVVCALLRNALTCLYKNTTSKYFELDPPALQEYFAWLQVVIKITFPTS